MTERLTIEFTPAEGAVVRMLGLIERRGYVLHGVAMDEAGGGASLRVDVGARDSGRRVEVLAQQLRRLIDVTKVSLATSRAGTFA